MISETLVMVALVLERRIHRQDMAPRQVVLRSLGDTGYSAREGVEIERGMTVAELSNALSPLSASVHPSRNLHAQLQHLDEVEIQPSATGCVGPLCGGGGDGGVTGTDRRATLAINKLRKRGADELDPQCERIARWSLCALTAEPLRPGMIAVDPLGSVYDYEALLRALSDRSSVSSTPASSSQYNIRRIAHIRSLKKDVVRTRLGVQPDLAASSSAAQHKYARQQNSNSSSKIDEEELQEKLACPITGLPFNGTFRFVALKPSGIVVSERALKEFSEIVSELLPAEQTLKQQQRITINPEGEELEKQRVQFFASKASKRTATPADTTGMSSKKQRRNDQAPVAHLMPEHATKEVWNSLFTSSIPERKIRETFTARALSGRNT